MNFSQTALAIAFLVFLLSLGGSIAASYSYDGVASFQAFPCPIEGCNGDQPGDGGRTPGSVCKDGYCSNFERLYGTCPEDCPPEEEEEEQKCPRAGGKEQQTEYCESGDCCYSPVFGGCYERKCISMPDDKQCENRNQMQCLHNTTEEELANKTYINPERTSWCCKFEEDGTFKECGDEFRTCVDRTSASFPEEEDTELNQFDPEKGLPPGCDCTNTKLVLVDGQYLEGGQKSRVNSALSVYYKEKKETGGECVFYYIAQTPGDISAVAGSFPDAGDVVFMGHGNEKGIGSTTGFVLSNLVCPHGTLKLVSCQTGKPRLFLGIPVGLPPEVKSFCSIEGNIGKRIRVPTTNITYLIANPTCGYAKEVVEYECTGVGKARKTGVKNPSLGIVETRRSNLPLELIKALKQEGINPPA